MPPAATLPPTSCCYAAGSIPSLSAAPELVACGNTKMTLLDTSQIKAHQKISLNVSRCLCYPANVAVLLVVCLAYGGTA